MKKARSLARSVHSLEELVEEQCQRAELSARAMSVQPPEPGEQWPVITISSEAGAGGKQLGENIAKNFAFAFWGSQLLARVAKELHAVESVLADVDGRVSSSVTDFVRSLLVGLEYSQGEYLRVLTKVINRIGQRGAAVIMGHGAHLILGPQGALRVRVVCAEPVRVQKIAQEKGLSGAAAKRELKKRDSDKAAFIRHHFKKDVADPHEFDLIVNSGAFDIAQATELVRQAYRAKFGKLVGARKSKKRSEKPVLRADEVHAAVAG